METHASPVPARSRTRHDRVLGRLALAAVALLVLTGCSGGESLHVAPGEIGKPTSGGTLRLALDGDPTCLDFQQTGTNVSLNIGRQMTDSLTDMDPATGRITPWLATRWEVSPDSTRFTFHLRKGVKFQNGEKFDAGAVKENIRAIQDLGPQASLAGNYLHGLEAVDTPDEHTVVFRFDSANAQFLQATSTMSLGFYAPETLRSTTPEQRCSGGTYSTGPFVLDQYVSNQTVSLHRNEDYRWASPLAKHQGPAYLKGLEFEVVPEATVRNGSLSSGQTDVDLQVLPQNEEMIEHSDFSLHTRANPGAVYSFFPNVQDPVLSDRKVREAMLLGTNRSQLTALLSRNQSPASSTLAKTTPEYSDADKGRLRHDPDRARKLLDDAGWTMNEDTGIREKDGKPLRVSVAYFQTAPFLDLVQQQYREIGIDLDLKKVSVGEANSKTMNHDYQMAFYNITRADPDVLRSLFSTEGRDVNNRTEPGSIDRLLARTNGTTDSSARKESVRRANQALLEEGYAIPLVELSGTVATAPRVQGFAFEASSRIQLHDTWKVGGKDS